MGFMCECLAGSQVRNDNVLPVLVTVLFCGFIFHRKCMFNPVSIE